MRSSLSILSAMETASAFVWFNISSSWLEKRKYLQSNRFGEFLSIDKYSPSLEVAFRILPVFDVPLEWVFHYDPPRNRGK
jgi:hypothetical protein